MVSAWPEPPSGKPAVPSAEAIAEAFTERIALPNWRPSLVMDRTPVPL